MSRSGCLTKVVAPRAYERKIVSSLFSAFFPKCFIGINALLILPIVLLMLANPVLKGGKSFSLIIKNNSPRSGIVQ